MMWYVLSEDFLIGRRAKNNTEDFSVLLTLAEVLLKNVVHCCGDRCDRLSQQEASRCNKLALLVVIMLFIAFFRILYSIGATWDDSTWEIKLKIKQNKRWAEAEQRKRKKDIKLITEQYYLRRAFVIKEESPLYACAVEKLALFNLAVVKQRPQFKDWFF